VLGGIGNVVGAMVGGLFLGMIEAMGVLVMPAEYKEYRLRTALVFVLIFRPQGDSGEWFRRGREDKAVWG